MEIREKAVKGRQVIGALGRILQCRNMNMGLRNSIVLPTLTYALETWTWMSHPMEIQGSIIENSSLKGGEFGGNKASGLYIDGLVVLHVFLYTVFITYDLIPPQGGRTEG